MELTGKEKVGEREAYVLILKPKSGTVVRQFIDTASNLPIKTITTIEVPEVGAVDQTTELFDFRSVDGVKVPFKVINSSSVQTLSIIITKVEHNTKIDETLFSKPVEK